MSSPRPRVAEKAVTRAGHNVTTANSGGSDRQRASPVPKCHHCADINKGKIQRLLVVLSATAPRNRKLAFIWGFALVKPAFYANVKSRLYFICFRYRADRAGGWGFGSFTYCDISNACSSSGLNFGIKVLQKIENDKDVR